MDDLFDGLKCTRKYNWKFVSTGLPLRMLIQFVPNAFSR